MKAVSYLRVSGLGQVEGDGFPRQREAVESFAKRAGLVIVDEYRDEGVSGANELDDRPGLGELINRIETNGVRTVLVENADRVARDLMIFEIILSKFLKMGVQVIEVGGGQDLTVADGNPIRKFIRQVLGAVSELDKSVLVAKLKAARSRIRKTGKRCEGRKPYGYRPGESGIVEKIKQLRRKPRMGERLSFAQIAAQLNAEGVPTRSGGVWRASTIGAILGRD
jgi:DNA invertase Pin-like site-specific DNA recombinase